MKSLKFVLQKNIEMYGTDKQELKMEKVDSLYTLNLEQRWQLYFNIVRDIKNELLAKMDVLLVNKTTVTYLILTPHYN